MIQNQIKLSLIVAMDKARVIGKDGDLPWRLKSDMKWFVANTKAKPVLMGRKTWDSLPKKPLKGRANFVLSRSEGEAGSLSEKSGAWWYTSFEVLLEAAKAQAAATGAEEVMVIGGAAFYEMALPLADKLYLTEVAAEIEGGDTWFPEFDRSAFKETFYEAHEAGDGDEHGFCFKVLERV